MGRFSLRPKPQALNAVFFRAGVTSPEIPVFFSKYWAKSWLPRPTLFIPPPARTFLRLGLNRPMRYSTARRLSPLKKNLPDRGNATRGADFVAKIKIRTLPFPRWPQTSNRPPHVFHKRELLPWSAATAGAPFQVPRRLLAAPFFSTPTELVAGFSYPRLRSGARRVGVGSWASGRRLSLGATRCMFPVILPSYPWFRLQQTGILIYQLIHSP